MTAQAFAEYAFFKTGYFVDGKWHSAQETFDVLNPATGEVIAQVAKAGKKRPRPLSPPPAARSPPGAPKPRKNVLKFSIAGISSSLKTSARLAS